MIPSDREIFTDFFLPVDSLLLGVRSAQQHNRFDLVKLDISVPISEMMVVIAEAISLSLRLTSPSFIVHCSQINNIKMVKVAHQFFITICAASDSGGMEVSVKK